MAEINNDCMTEYELLSLGLLSAIAGGISTLVARESLPLRSEDQREAELRYQQTVNSIIKNAQEVIAHHRQLLEKKYATNSKPLI